MAIERAFSCRAKDIDTGEWVYGWYCKYPFGKWPLKDAIIPEQDAEEGYHHFVQVDGKTVGDFTGKLDKNYKPIYVGDIVKKKDYNGLQNMRVVFVDGKYMCWYKRATKFYTLDDSRIEVVGNIFDSPEMESR